MWHKVRLFLQHSYSNRAKRRLISLRLHNLIKVDTLEGLLESQSKGFYVGVGSYD